MGAYCKPDRDTTSVAITLRELKPSDLEPVHQFLSDWTVVRYMLLPHCTTKKESREYLNELTAKNSGAVWLSVVRAIEIRNHPGSAVGLCGIAIQRGSEQGEIWYLVNPDHWGQGIATKAARELLRIGFSGMNLHRLCATCLPENPASLHVLEKIGMRKEGYHFRNLKIHGIWHDCYSYAILREEWESLMRHREPEPAASE
jgi:RimJ/RimL family protein N-acetyltransferase